MPPNPTLKIPFSRRANRRPNTVKPEVPTFPMRLFATARVYLMDMMARTTGAVAASRGAKAYFASLEFWFYRQCAYRAFSLEVKWLKVPR